MLAIQVDMSFLDRKLAETWPNMMKGIRIGLKQCAVELIKEARVEVDGHFNISAHSLVPRAIQVNEAQTTPVSVVVGLNKTTCPHAIYLHEGTKKHFVGVKSHDEHGDDYENAQALHWVSGGQSFFSKGHEVSGIEKYQFIYIAAEKLRETFSSIIQAAVGRAIAAKGSAE